MKIITYNVNGIRSALAKGLATWLRAIDADLVCLQEIRAEGAQVSSSVFRDLGYHSYWFPAQKKGYSGVAILSRTLPRQVEYGCGSPSSDAEGRVLRADFVDFSLLSVYVPSGASSPQRQAFKMAWLADFAHYLRVLRQTHPRLLVSGDYNICHQPIDIHNPKANAQSPGFLPEERQWVTQLLDSGFVDAFRVFNSEPHHYTWWSTRYGVRERNLGWRIDYHLVTENMRPRLRRAVLLPDARHSDHCPALLELDTRQEHIL